MFSPFCPVDIRMLDRIRGLEAIESLLEGANGLCVLASETMVTRLALHEFVQGLLNRHDSFGLRTSLRILPFRMWPGRSGRLRERK